MAAHIVHLIPFPITDARHGGQIRARETNRALREAGFQISTIEIFDAGGNPALKPAVDVSSALSSGKWPLDWQIRDYVSGLVVAEDEEAFSAFKSAVPMSAEIIVIEEPWLGPAVLRLKREGHFSGAIVFNSYNVEHVAKANILREAAIDGSETHVANITGVERDLLANADMVTAVTEGDAAIFRRLYERGIIVAPNGSVKRRRSHLSGLRFHGIEQSSPYALFVGSAHPPNVSGFQDLVLKSIHYLKSHERVVVAGSVCGPLHHNVVSGPQQWMLRDKLCLVGSVSDFELDCLIENSSMFLLPVKYGGGSNLKTAEALLTEKPIVATDVAFRGYDAYRKSSGVRYGNTPDEFGQAMRETFDSLGRYPRSNVEQLTFAHTLMSLVSGVTDLMNGQVASR